MPKTLLDVGGKPILYWVLNWLKQYGVSHLVLGVAYKKEMIYEYMEENDYFGFTVDFSEHTIEGGTAEGFRLAARYVYDDNFIAMNSDELTNMNLDAMWKSHISKGMPLTMALSSYNARLSVVKIDKEGRLLSFEYAHKIPEILVSVGIYAFRREICNLIPENGSIEDLLFAKLVSDRLADSYILGGGEEWVSVNNQKELLEAEKAIRGWNVRT